jgi:phosphoketolase
MAPSRVGKVHLGAYLHRDFKRSLMLVRAATGKTETQIIADALNDVFRAHNVPVIDAE